MTATIPDYATDLLAELDESARLSVTGPHSIREAWLECIQAVSDRDGDYDAARVRAIVPEEYRHGSEVGNLFRHLSKSGAAVMVGTCASGYKEHRAETTIIKRWKLTRQVFPEVTR